MSVFRRLRKYGEIKKETAVKYNGSLALAMLKQATITSSWHSIECVTHAGHSIAFNVVLHIRFAKAICLIVLNLLSVKSIILTK